MPRLGEYTMCIRCGSCAWTKRTLEYEEENTLIDLHIICNDCGAVASDKKRRIWTTVKAIEWERDGESEK